VTALDHPAQRAALADKVLLASEFVQCPRSHARGERGMGGRTREIERLLICWLATRRHFQIIPP
jgi:hypothetical protein